MDLILEVKGKEYRLNDYMRGQCPKCHNWTAPITENDLVVFPHLELVHEGSTTRVTDKKVQYLRQTWKELFRCPKCETRFAVPYSSL